MSVIKRVLKEGEKSINDKINERIRILCGWSKDAYYDGMVGRGGDLTCERNPLPLGRGLNL